MGAILIRSRDCSYHTLRVDADEDGIALVAGDWDHTITVCLNGEMTDKLIAHLIEIRGAARIQALLE